MERKYLDKKTCLAMADEIIAGDRIAGMTRQQIAEEIYAHASAYYFCGWLERFRLRFRFIMDRADPIDLADHGDKPFRRFCYKVFWHLAR